MRKLKTPSELMTYFTDDGECPDLTYSYQDVEQIILAAQRDALDCAAENAKLEVIEVPGAGSFMHRIVKSSILNLLPKEK